MCKKTNDSVKFNLFSNPKDLLNEKSRKKFSDPVSWDYLGNTEIT